VLLRNGATVDVVDSRGNTPMHLAASVRKFDAEFSFFIVFKFEHFENFNLCFIFVCGNIIEINNLYRLALSLH
jgi:hypothetical protein